MIVLPAVDIRGGRCVRLRQGRAEDSTEYYARPIEAALHWQAEGAQALHLVDLDGALGESGGNWIHVSEVLRTLEIPVEVGGGLREMEALRRVLGVGAARAVVGTRAVLDPGWALQVCSELPGRIVIALDARDGRVAVRGWQENSGVDVLELARRLEAAQPAAFLYTDVSVDGMLCHPNLDGVRALLEATQVPVIASGGVASLDDIEALAQLGADAVVVGKALYEGSLTLPDALRVAGQSPSRLSTRPEPVGPAPRSDTR